MSIPKKKSKASREIFSEGVGGPGMSAPKKAKDKKALPKGTWRPLNKKERQEQEIVKKGNVRNLKDSPPKVRTSQPLHPTEFNSRP
tara:strand:- start:7285 stop:7542 length:258 start_codon:yes stop_codon:yes gene_type:complete